MVILGTFIKSLFFDPTNGMAAFLLLPKGSSLSDCHPYLSESGLIKVVGKFCIQQRGMPLHITGDWGASEYGAEFVAQGICETALSMDEAQELLLELKTGATLNEVKKVLKVTGEDLFSVSFIPDIDGEVSDRSGVDITKVYELLSKIRNISRELGLTKFLDGYNGTYEHARKILDKFPDNAVQMLREDPYKVWADTGVPFKVIDRIALDYGVDELSEARIRAVLLHAIRSQTNAGHTYMTIDELSKIVGAAYGDIPMSSIVAGLKDHPYIVRDEAYPDLYYEAHMLADEKSAAKDFARLVASRKELPFHPDYIGQIEKLRNFKFGNQQRDAFQLLQSTGPKLLTGDPGTGKTTTVNGLLQYIEMVMDHPKIALCAPSGRAAQRMKETTQRTALTIHKLIEYQPYGDGIYCKDFQDPIDADVIVVDEVSMLGLATFARFLNAVKSGSLVLFVGDTNQLQSVEPGDVLQDIIRCGLVDSCHLTEVYRQAAESKININAKKIISGDTGLEEGEDFHLTECTEEDMPDLLVSSVKACLQAGVDKDNIQVLSPIKKGEAGVRAANTLLQKLLNPDKGGIWRGFRNFKNHDRVIMLSNNYRLDYYNGDIGFITDCSDAAMRIQVGDVTVHLPRKQYSDMELAYCCSVHKSQGSEYGHVILLLPKEAKGMLDQNLLYTAVTRAKKEIHILYVEGALETAINTKRRGSRRSMLAVRIRTEAVKCGVEIPS